MGVAYIGRITEINPIKDADMIESARVVCGQGGIWSGTVKKGDVSVGDLVEVYLQDALLPQINKFSFMEKSQYIVKMRRLRGVPSECLIMPMSLNMTKYGVPGMDISEVMGVQKYSKPLPANMGGETLGWFPSFIPKTDEPNFQTVPHMVEYLAGKRFYSTVKQDGSSATVYKYQGHFGCCSRNMELKETPNNAIWQIARKYNMEENLIDGFALQMEIVGPGVQGNPIGLKQVEPRLFNVYDIDMHKYENGEFVMNYAKETGIPAVDIVDWNGLFGNCSEEELREYAEGLYPNGKQREGVVVRPMEEATLNGERVSIKIINLLYKG